MELIYPSKKPLTLPKSKLRPISMLRGLGPFLCVTLENRLMLLIRIPVLLNGFDQLMFMHCFEDANILMKVYTHICWQTIFSTEITSKYYMTFNATRLEKSQCDYLLSVHVRTVNGLDIGIYETDICC